MSPSYGDFNLLTVPPAFLHSLGSQTPAEGACLKPERSEEENMTDSDPIDNVNHLKNTYIL